MFGKKKITVNGSELFAKNPFYIKHLYFSVVLQQKPGLGMNVLKLVFVCLHVFTLTIRAKDSNLLSSIFSI